MRKLLILGAGLIISGFAAWFLDTSGANAQVTSVVVPGIPVFFGLVDEYIENSRKTKQERVRELLADDFYRNPLVVAIYLILALQLLQRAIGMVLGAAMGAALDAAGKADTAASIVTSLSPFFALLLSLPLSVLLAKYAAHHIQSRAVLWISGAFVVSQLISEALVFVLMGGAASIINAVVAITTVIIVCLLLVGCAALGSWWAGRTHQAFIMTRLFKRLSPSDRRDLIDLVQTLPGIPN